MDSNKKVTFIISSLTGGGAESICINIANSFAKNGWHVDLVVLNSNNEVYLDRISNNVNLVILNVNHIRYSALPLLKYLYKNKIKTVLVFNHELAVILIILRILFRLKIKIISRNISVLSFKMKQLKLESFWERHVVRLLINYFYQKIDHVVNQCHSMQDDLISLFPKLYLNSSVIYNPISIHIEEYLKKNDLTKNKKKKLSIVRRTFRKSKRFLFCNRSFF